MIIQSQIWLNALSATLNMLITHQRGVVLMMRVFVSVVTSKMKIGIVKIDRIF
jgi:hypothetical protein